MYELDFGREGHDRDDYIEVSEAQVTTAILKIGNTDILDHSTLP